jgi:Terminase RNaseH-like domain
VSVEAGLLDMLQRMESGRFKVVKHLNDWWEEFRLYHRKDGKVVKESDDLMSATRYAVMMLRFAAAPTLGQAYC